MSSARDPGTPDRDRFLAPPDLDRRRLTPERMDDPSLPPAEHLAALVALRRIHRVSFSARLLMQAIREAVARVGATREHPLRVLDYATGGGDLLVDCARISRRERLPVAFAGCDLSPVGLERAARLARGEDVRLFQQDALSDVSPPGAPYHLTTCSLFLHHLDHEKAQRLLRRMADVASVGVVVHDLERSLLGWRLAWLASRTLTRSPVVHFDALRSVEGAFTATEALDLARAVGWSDPSCRRAWPARFVLTWWRS